MDTSEPWVRVSQSHTRAGTFGARSTRVFGDHLEHLLAILSIFADFCTVEGVKE